MHLRRWSHLVLIIALALGALSWQNAQAQNADREPVLIHFRQNPGNAEQALVRSAGGNLKYTYRIVPVIAASLPAPAIAALGRNPQVTRIEPDFELHADVLPNDAQFNALWGLHNTGQTGGTPDADIDAPEAWDLTTGSASVVIAVVDTGAQVEPGFSGTVATHPDLAANMWVNPGEIDGDGIDNDGNGHVDDIYGWNFFDNAPWVYYSAEEDAHGTHVSGTIAAVGNNGTGVTGINWYAQVMIAKFIGPGGTGSTSDAIAGIQYAAENGAQVINASWGGGGYSQALKDAIEASGALFVAAAGNGGFDQIGDNTDIAPHYPSSYNSANLIAVAATDHNDQIAYFSNFGATSVDLGAPGVSVRSTVPTSSYDTYSGTSMATPHVSGVAGLVISGFPGITPLEVKNQILGTVDPIAALNGITVTGGRLNAASAVGGAAPPPPPPPPPPDEAVQDYALSDVPASGTVSGNYTDTHVSDDGFETLTETESGGRPDRRRSFLEHKWIFDVTGGETVTFFLEAYRDNNSENDNFAFAYSTNDSTYSPLVVVNSATEQLYSAALPNTVSGTVYVRVTDTDRTQGNRALDSIHIDQMYFESFGTPPPPPPGPTAVFVQPISYDTKGGKNQSKDLLSTVTLLDDLGNPVGGAVVDIVLIHWDSFSTWNALGTTGSAGSVTFILGNAPAGLYTTGVQAIDAGGLTWDGITPDNYYTKSP